MVCPGNPPGCHTLAPAPDRAGLCDRLVHLATSPSGDGPNLTPQTKGATVVLGAGLQSAVWLYWFWHSGLPLAIIGYALLKDTDRVADVRFTRRAVSLSVAGVLALVIGLFWFVTQHEDLLPTTFV